MMMLWKLFVLALMPMLKVLSLTAIGAIAAHDRFDILRENASKPLNTIVFYLLTPALLFSSLGETITLKSLVMLWFMPMNVLLASVAGTILGLLLIKKTKTPHHLQGLVLGCCSAGNLGNMPLIIVPAMCTEGRGAFGAVDVCNKKGLAYTSLSLALGSIYNWSYVFNLVRMYSCNSPSVNKAEELEVISVSGTETHAENPSKCSNGHLNTTLENGLQENGHVAQLEIPCANGEAKVPEKATIMKQLKLLGKKMNLKAILAPATIGAIVGIVIGVVTPFRKLFIGDNAPLHVIQDSASTLGVAAIPVMTLLVGANLLKGFKGFKSSGMQLSILVGIVAVRFIVLPVVGIGILKGAIHFGLIHSEPLYQFVLLLQFAVPPAMAISTMTQLFGVGDGECSVIMLATYCCATVSLTLWYTFFMWLVL